MNAINHENHLQLKATDIDFNAWQRTKTIQAQDAATLAGITGSID